MQIEWELEVFKLKMQKNLFNHKKSYLGQKLEKIEASFFAKHQIEIWDFGFDKHKILAGRSQMWGNECDTWLIMPVLRIFPQRNTWPWNYWETLRYGTFKSYSSLVIVKMTGINDSNKRFSIRKKISSSNYQKKKNKLVLQTKKKLKKENKVG